MEISVDLCPVADLAPYARNARKHNAAAINRLVSIIAEVGWTNPILVDEAGIIAGHKRRLAALEIYKAGGTIRLPSGRELPAGMVPVLDVSGWTEAQRRAYIIADNQTTLESEWDAGVLRLELSWLQGSGEVDMELTGFDGDALSAALVAEKVSDGFSGGDEKPPSERGAMVVVGPYRVLLETDAMNALLLSLRTEGDDDEDRIAAAIKARLGVVE